MKKSIPTKIPTNGISANKRITLLIFCLLINILFTKTLLASTTTKNRDSLKLTQKEYLIKGKVYDEKGILMPGVTVLLDSTKIGVTTDMEGAFLLRLPQPKGNLVFSFIGFSYVKHRGKGKIAKEFIPQVDPPEGQPAENSSPQDTQPNA